MAFLLACLFENIPLVLINKYLPPFFLENKLEMLPIKYAVGGKLLSYPSLALTDLTASSTAKKTLLCKRPDLERPYTILFTSGTTSQPKLAALSGENHLYSAIAFQDSAPITPDDVWALSMPLYHVAGLGILFRCLLHGAAIYLPTKGAFLPDDITHISLVETTVKRLIKNPLPEKLSFALIGGGPISQEMIGLCKAHHIPAHFTYGLTEMSSHVSIKALDDKGKVSSFGRPHRYAEYRIKNRLLYLRGKTRFLGYYESGSLQKIPRKDWFCTGDLARIQKEELAIIGRKDRLFISGGENIQPEEIENALMQIPGMISAKVIPKPDLEYGMRPIAILDMKPRMDTKTLQKALKKMLPPYKIPQKILYEGSEISTLQGKFF